MDQATERNLQPGDPVRLKGDEKGPNMTITGRDQDRSDDSLECSYWDTAQGFYRTESFHRNALELHAKKPPKQKEETVLVITLGDREVGRLKHGEMKLGERKAPEPTLVEGVLASVAQFGVEPYNPGASYGQGDNCGAANANVAVKAIAPTTVSLETLKVAIRNGRRLIDIGVGGDKRTLVGCFEVLVDELLTHVDVKV